MAVVTGAARGTGAALAAALCEAGAGVALLGRKEERLRETAAVLPLPILCVEADVTDQAALVAAARQVEVRLGAADVVVASAGIVWLFPPSPRHRRAHDERTDRCAIRFESVPTRWPWPTRAPDRGLAVVEVEEVVRTHGEPSGG
ncbi:SDR family NAD(P)-dependent oxidoreductase [Streptomyces sp. NPDC001450]